MNTQTTRPPAASLEAFARRCGFVTFRALLIKWYVLECRTSASIAEELGYTRQTVARFLRANNIKRRGMKIVVLSKEEKQKWEVEFKKENGR